MVLAVANAGHLGIGLVGPTAAGAVLTGPGAHASLVGPDGSHIAGSAAGGVVIAPPRHGGSIAAGVVPGHVAVGHVGLGVGHVGLGLGLGLGHGHGAVIAGPAGTVVSDGVHGGWGHGGWAAGGWGHGGGLHPLAAGSGLEGQWIPDGTEHLYDDGSYKGEWDHGHGW